LSDYISFKKIFYVDFVAHHFLNPILFFKSNDVSRKFSAIVYAFLSFCDRESMKLFVVGVAGAAGRDDAGAAGRDDAGAAGRDDAGATGDCLLLIFIIL